MTLVRTIRDAEKAFLEGHDEQCMSLLGSLTTQCTLPKPVHYSLLQNLLISSYRHLNTYSSWETLQEFHIVVTEWLTNSYPGIEIPLFNYCSLLQQSGRYSDILILLSPLYRTPVSELKPLPFLSQKLFIIYYTALVKTDRFEESLQILLNFPTLFERDERISAFSKLPNTLNIFDTLVVTFMHRFLSPSIFTEVFLKRISVQQHVPLHRTQFLSVTQNALRSLFNGDFNRSAGLLQNVFPHTQDVERMICLCSMGLLYELVGDDGNAYYSFLTSLDETMDSVPLKLELGMRMKLGLANILLRKQEWKSAIHLLLSSLQTEATFSTQAKLPVSLLNSFSLPSSTILAHPSPSTSSTNTSTTPSPSTPPISLPSTSPSSQTHTDTILPPALQAQLDSDGVSDLLSRTTNWKLLLRLGEAVLWSASEKDRNATAAIGLCEVDHQRPEGVGSQRLSKPRNRREERRMKDNPKLREDMDKNKAADEEINKAVSFGLECLIRANELSAVELGHIYGRMERLKARIRPPLEAAGAQKEPEILTAASFSQMLTLLTQQAAAVHPQATDVASALPLFLTSLYAGLVRVYLHVSIAVVHIHTLMTFCFLNLHNHTEALKHAKTGLILTERLLSLLTQPLDVPESVDNISERLAEHKVRHIDRLMEEKGLLTLYVFEVLTKQAAAKTQNGEQTPKVQEQPADIAGTGAPSSLFPVAPSSETPSTPTPEPDVPSLPAVTASLFQTVMKATQNTPLSYSLAHLHSFIATNVISSIPTQYLRSYNTAVLRTFPLSSSFRFASVINYIKRNDPSQAMIVASGKWTIPHSDLAKWIYYVLTKQQKPEERT
ncbi:hypothetical protein BLNAU_11897 [Blattamonas nauphoetae]|uniref:CCR4-NOT transcription complex subunit 11 n=1 Tax=Blattamonas nauphoetae TaxID=2049346 RepID=A0ABQ9XQZ1_9EUKA|nr:hypothetical protein BLNAU_11897 [Blattamonas nauphoetae]